MAYFVIENFSNGMDLRRSPDTAPAGSLRMLRNAFINTGGEIEKRKSWSIMPKINAYTQDPANKGLVVGPVLTPWALGNVAFFNLNNTVYTDDNFELQNGECSLGTINEDDEETLLVTAIRCTAFTPDPTRTLRHVSSGAAAFGREGMQYIGEYNPANTFVDDYPIHVRYNNDGRIAQEVTYISDVYNHEALFVLDQKAYSVNAFSLYASAVGDIADWQGTGSGIVDLNKLSGHPIGILMGLEEYYGQLAVFARKGVQLWDTDPDFDLNQYVRTIPIQPVAPRTITPYTSGDVLFLDRSGIRSLRAREISETAQIDDVGSPIDAVAEQALDYQYGVPEDIMGYTLSPADFNYLSTACIFEELGQYWIFLRNVVFVLSSFQDAKVRAWAMYDLPQATNPNPDFSENLNKYVADVAQVNSTVMFRNFGDDVFLYGGSTSDKYDTAEAEIITPHMDFGRPGTNKEYTGIDLACVGTWDIEISLDVNNIVWEKIATVTNSSHRLTGRIPFDARSTHIALRLTSTSPERAKIGQMTIFYNDGGDV